MEQEQTYYRHRLFELVDDFIERDLQGDESKLESPKFAYMIEVIKDELPYIDRNDTENLDAAFSAYLELSLKYNRLPSLMMFGRLIKMQPCTMSRWKHGVFRSGSKQQDLVKKWQAICEAYLIDSLGNSDKTSVNRIFIAKAVYGFRDDPNDQMELTTDQNKTLTAGDLPRLSIDDIDD